MTLGFDPEPLALRVFSRDPAGVARAISMVEDRRPEAEGPAALLLRALNRSGRSAACQRIGVTGPPGVGKSSLVSALIRRFRASDKSVGVLAVDPSSPRSGGALLGDRARIELDPDDTEVFVRSMASGGQLGGLARAAGAAVEVLSSTFDVVLIETVGVGQSETDVEHVADCVLLVVQPASGDVLQFIKAGILEIPDLLAVNKADLGAVAERARAELESALRVSATVDGRVPPRVILTSATTGAGVDELLSALNEHSAELRASGTLSSRRHDKSVAWAVRLFVEQYGERGVEVAGGRPALRASLGKALAGGATLLEAMSAAAAPAD